MNLSDLIQFNDPQYYSGGAEGGTDILRPQTIKTIAGIPVDQFIQRKGPDSMGPSGEVGPTGQVFNPLTGQWEVGYVVPGLDNTQLIPESIAKQIPGSASYAGTTPKDVHDYTQGLQALGIVAGGVLGGGALTGALGGAGAAGAGLAGATTADIAGLTGASGAIGGGGSLASLAGAGGGLEFAGGPELFSGGGAVGGGAAGTGAAGAAPYTGGLQLTGTSGLGFQATPGAVGAFNSGVGIDGLTIPGSTSLAGITNAGATAAGVGTGGSILGGMTASGLGSAASTAASTGSIIDKIVNGTATTADYLKAGVSALPGLLGAYGASQQASALSDLADKYYNAGAPSRARYEASMTPGFDPTTIPGYSGALDSASGAILSKLSTQGNPYGNPGGLIEANKAIVNGTALPAVQNYQSLNANAGGISSMNAAAPGVAQQAIGSSGGVLSALGSAAGSVFNPPQTADQSTASLADLLKKLGYGSSNRLA